MASKTSAPGPELSQVPVNVLVVDDDEALRSFVSKNLSARGFSVVAAENGLACLEHFDDTDNFDKNEPDLVVLDIMMPHLDGYETCRRIRKTSTVPVIVLTAMGGEGDIVRALDCGADDCMTKPFGVEELMARVRSVLRRAEPRDPTDGPKQITFRELNVDLDANRAWVGRRELDLTRTEFGVLSYYARNLNRTVPHDEVLVAIWGDQYETESHYIRLYVSRLRAKIETGSDQPYFVTEHGIGYRLGS